MKAITGFRIFYFCDIFIKFFIIIFSSYDGLVILFKQGYSKFMNQGHN